MDYFLAGELLIETNGWILSHLEQCPSCREERAWREAARARLRRSWEAVPVPPPLPGRVRRVLPAEEGTGRFFESALLLLGAALGAVLWVFSLCEMGPGPKDGSVENRYDQVIGHHLNCAGTHPGSFPLWIRLEAVKRLEAALQGSRERYRLWDIRLCRINGPEWAHLILQGRWRRFSIILKRQKSEQAETQFQGGEQSNAPGLTFQYVCRSGLCLVSFEAPGCFVCLVSEEEGQDHNLQLAGRILPVLKEAVLVRG